MPLLAVPAAGFAAALGTSDPTGYLLQYGPIGIISILLILGLVVPKPLHDRVVAENERLRTLVESALPLVAHNSDVTAEAMALIRLMQTEISRQSRVRRQ